jgi:L-fuconolactonase
MSKAPIVDSHHHFWVDPTVSDYPWMTGPMEPIRRTFGPEELRPHLARCGVTNTVLVQTRSSLEETETFLHIAQTVDFVAGVVGWIDLTAPSVKETIKQLLSGPGGHFLAGIRHQVHDEGDAGWLQRPDVISGLQAVSEAGLVYDLLVRPRELPAALTVARRFPELRLVIDHSAKPPIKDHVMDGWAEGMAPFSDLPNVYCKLSGLVTEADWEAWRVDYLRPYSDQVLGWFGSERVMYGSDWPVCTLAATYEEVYRAYSDLLDALPEDARDAVLGGNAIRWYGLDLNGRLRSTEQ